MSALVSILTPSLDQGEYLSDCLLSVSRQTHHPIEHIVFDGGSTDGTLDLLKSRPSPHLQWVSAPDGGQADALNRAFEASRGDVIGWVNADDALFDTGSVAAVLRHLDDQPDCDAVYGDVLIIDGLNRLVRHHRSRWPSDWTKLPPHASPLPQPAVFIRRSAIEKLGRFLRSDLHVSLDLELWLRMRAAGCRFDRIDRVLAVDRDHEHRKVHRLHEMRVRENMILAFEYGIQFSEKHHDRVKAWIRRWSGAIELVGLERHYHFAIPIECGAVLPRIARQLLVTNRRAAGHGR